MIIPFLNRGATPFLTLVKSSSARKAAAETRLRFYTDRQTDDLLNLIRARWSTPEDFRLFSINIVRKIVNRRAQVYRAPAFRVFDGMQQEAGEALYAAMAAPVVLKKANRLATLCKTTVLQVGWSEVRQAPTLAVIAPNALDVEHDGDPEYPHRLIVTHKGSREADTTYSDWTAASYTRRDAYGRPIRLDGNPDGVNPYGVLPFVPCFAADPDDAFFLPGGDDIIEAQRAVNVALANLWRAIELQAHGQAWAAGIPSADILRSGPDRVISLPTEGKFGFAAPNAPIADVLRAIEFLVKQTAVANDLAANVFELDAKAESGAAKAAESVDLMEARADDLELWRHYEARLFDVVKRVVNTHRPGTIPEGATMRVDFGEVTAPMDEAARLDSYQRRVDLGIWSPVDALLADNPDIRSREDAIAILQERQEETAMLRPGLPTMTFTGASTDG